MANVWLNGEPDSNFPQPLNTPFQFDLKLPPAPPGGGQLPFLRVAEGPASRVHVDKREGDTVHITINPPDTSGYGPYFWQLILGYLDDGLSAPSAAGSLFTVHLNSIEIVDDLDPTCCGDWTLFVSMNGDWRKIFGFSTAHDGDTVHDGDIFPLGIDIPVVGPNLLFRAIGYEDDNPWAGESMNTGVPGPTVQGQPSVVDLVAIFGPLSAWANGSTHVVKGCSGYGSSDYCNGGAGAYLLYFTVDKSYDGPTVLPTSSSLFWLTRLADEPNAPVPHELGTVHVPAQGAPALTTEHLSYLTEGQQLPGNVRVLSQDVDIFHFTLDEFANVTYGPLPTGVVANELASDDWYFNGSLPDSLKKLTGYRGANVVVVRASGQPGDQPYTLQINTTWRDLPPDWGEDADALFLQGKGPGRPVDLNTPDAAAQVWNDSLYNIVSIANRRLEKDWAWQHVKGDVDYYDIWFPAATAPGPPAGHVACTYDVDPGLTIEAQGMKLYYPTGDPGLPSLLSAEDSVTLDLATNPPLGGPFPDRHVAVQVASKTGQRGFYRLNATWNDGAYLTGVQCAAVAVWQKASGYKFIDWKSVYIPQLNLPDPPPEASQLALFGLGGYKLVQAGQGGTFDAILSTKNDQPVLARLYDANGILLGESLVQDEASVGRTRIPDGLFPKAHLTVSGLSASDTFLLQVVPGFNVGGTGKAVAKVGLSQKVAGSSQAAAVLLGLSAPTAPQPSSATAGILTVEPNFSPRLSGFDELGGARELHTGADAFGLVNADQPLGRVSHFDIFNGDVGTKPSLASLANTQQSPVVSVQPSSQLVGEGQVFRVSVVVSDVANLGAFEFTLTYSPTLVQAITATLPVSSFLGSSGRTVAVPPAAPIIDNALGTIIFGAYSYGASPGVNGNGVLGVVTLQARALGTSNLSLWNTTAAPLELVDPSGNLLSVQAVGGQVDIRRRAYLPLIQK